CGVVRGKHGPTMQDAEGLRLRVVGRGLPCERAEASRFGRAEAAFASEYVGRVAAGERVEDECGGRRGGGRRRRRGSLTGVVGVGKVWGRRVCDELGQGAREARLDLVVGPAAHDAGVRLAVLAPRQVCDEVARGRSEVPAQKISFNAEECLRPERRVGGGGASLLARVQVFVTANLRYPPDEVTVIRAADVGLAAAARGAGRAPRALELVPPDGDAVEICDNVLAVPADGVVAPLAYLRAFVADDVSELRPVPDVACELVVAGLEPAEIAEAEKYRVPAAIAVGEHVRAARAVARHRPELPE